ncbi:MAG: branched-chain alpha-keto acid dehydrogenase subunit E2 [Gammaproteobacteria bacterium]|nr:branched-chain alpha-keto acid dehydrogenase subunit E2 [Gammaproteobacteria bacterium]
MSNSVEIKVPDIGDFAAVEIIELLVSVGDSVATEEPLITLESDKATMEVPSPQTGVIEEIRIQTGQSVAQGTVIMIMRVEEQSLDDQLTPDSDTSPDKPSESEPAENNESVSSTTSSSNESRDQSITPPASSEDRETPDFTSNTHPGTLPPPVERAGIALPHASPAVRRFARELGTDLRKVRGSGAKGRITREDVQNWVKQQLSTPSRPEGSGIPPIPEIDFSQFGEIETVALSRIKKLSGPHLQTAWLNIPHVTHHDEADITELEEFRQSLKAEAEKEQIKITLLAFVTKILASALKKFPTFNSSLHPNGDSLILKKYINIGIAVDTPQGLIVPVIKNAQSKSIFELAREMGELSVRAREGKLRSEDLKGGSMSISSLGGISGVGFTPIVNAPEVAILGVSRAKMTPIWDGETFQPRLILPISLSYDHRVIDGAEGARFAAYLSQSFGDVRRLSL